MTYPLLEWQGTDFRLTKLPSVEETYFKRLLYQCIFMVFHVGMFHDVSPMT